MKIYTIYDSKANYFFNPLVFRSRGEAIRAFTETVNNKESNFYKYPEDFTLFELGSWDETTSKFDLLATPHSVGLATEFKVYEDSRFINNEGVSSKAV